jgi:ubiquitin-protein ligase
MTLQEFISNGLLEAFSNHITSPQNAVIILESIGFPRNGRPRFPARGSDTTPYWIDVIQSIVAGRLTTGNDLQILVDAASRHYPTNDLFSKFATQSQPQQPPEGKQQEASPQPDSASATPVATRPNETQSQAPPSPTPVPPQPPPQTKRSEFVYLTLRGWENIESLIDTARMLADTVGMDPQSVIFATASADGVALELTGWPPDAARQLGQTLTQQAPRGEVQFTVASCQFREYLLSRLFVEGPDQQRFELNDIPASTPVRDIAHGVIGSEYYDPKMQASGTGLGKREVVVDRENPDGSTQRLDPDKSLHDHGIREGETLSVSPESTAGNVHPAMRDMALARVRNEVLDFAESHPGFEVLANSPFAPTEYKFHFHAPSFGPNPAGGEPLLIDEHQVRLTLPGSFPMAAPDVFWLTPIFHPNVRQEDPGYGYVCLGPLKDGYRPAMNFGDLCQWLIDLASFQNYAVQEGMSGEAQQWAVTPEGQIAIEQRGGKSVSRMLLHSFREPQRLWIKRAD